MLNGLCPSQPHAPSKKTVPFPLDMETAIGWTAAASIAGRLFSQINAPLETASVPQGRIPANKDALPVTNNSAKTTSLVGYVLPCRAADGEGLPSPKRARVVCGSNTRRHVDQQDEVCRRGITSARFALVPRRARVAIPPGPGQR